MIRWLTRNVADTDTGTHQDVVPLELTIPVEQAQSLVAQVIGSLTGWRVESIDAVDGTLHATRRTRLWRFVDDVTVRVEEAKTGSRVHARSKSRLGKGDFGQNRRNIKELFRALAATVAPS